VQNTVSLSAIGYRATEIWKERVPEPVGEVKGIFIFAFGIATFREVEAHCSNPHKTIST